MFVLCDVGDDLRIDEVGLSAEASDQKGNDISSLATTSPHLNAAIAVISCVDLGISIKETELSRVERVQLYPWIINCILQRDHIVTVGALLIDSLALQDAR